MGIKSTIVSAVTSAVKGEEGETPKTPISTDTTPRNTEMEQGMVQPSNTRENTPTINTPINMGTLVGGNIQGV
jgi:hypothetical protein